MLVSAIIELIETYGPFAVIVAAMSVIFWNITNRSLEKWSEVAAERSLKQYQNVFDEGLEQLKSDLRLGENVSNKQWELKYNTCLEASILCSKLLTSLRILGITEEINEVQKSLNNDVLILTTNLHMTCDNTIIADKLNLFVKYWSILFREMLDNRHDLIESHSTFHGPLLGKLYEDIIFCMRKELGFSSSEDQQEGLTPSELVFIASIT